MSDPDRPFPPLPAATRPTLPTAASRAALVLASVGTALALSLTWQKVWDASRSYNPYVLFAFAVVVSATWGRFWAGCAATVLAIAATGFFQLPPLFSFRVADPAEVVILGLFLVEGVILSAVAAALAGDVRLKEHHPAYRYAAAVGAVAGAVLVKLPFSGGVAEVAPFMLFYAAVLFAAWVGGAGPAVVATLLSAVAAAFFFLEPRFDLHIARPERAGQMLLFVLEGGLISLLGGSIVLTRRWAAQAEQAARRYWDDLRDSERRLRRQNDVLTDLSRRPNPEMADPDRPIRELTEAAATTLEVERVGVWLFDANRTRIRCLDLYERAGQRHTQGAELLAKDYPRYFAAIEQNRTLAAHDARADERTREFAAGYLIPQGITAMLDAPIRVGGEVRGVVCMEHVGPPRVWTVEEEQFAGSIADFLALALKRRELQAAEQKLIRVQRMESIGALAGGIAHDLNNLLTPVLLGAELLRQAETPAQRTALLDTIQASAERGSGLLRQILSFARGARPAERGPVELRPLVRQVKELLDHTLMKAIEVQALVLNDAWPVMGTAAQVDQVLMNLCVNARDAMPTGGRLTIAAQNRPLEEGDRDLPAGAAAGSYVMLTVADTGTGMPAEVVERIFDPFFTTKEPGRGTGLGLATTRDIVTGLGGWLRVESKVGDGSRFYVFLPAAQAAARPAKTDSKEYPPGKGELVLVVDDEASILELARRVLETYGYRVVLAASGAEAVARAAEVRAEVRAVLLDLKMPGQKVAATLGQLREAAPGVPVVLTSGHLQEVPGDLGGQVVAAVLAKPYSVSQLLQLLRRVLEAG